MKDELQPRLTETVVKQVLARAAQLDATSHAGVSIPDLRSAAVEAGISPGALEQALGELTGAVAAADDEARERKRSNRRRRRRVLAVIAVLVGLMGAFAVTRMVVPVSSEPVEEVRVPPAR